VTSTAADDIRALLYGDVPLDRWPAFSHVDLADPERARAAFRRIVHDPDRAARDHLQAWHAQRALGEQPPDPARLYGVVVDMPIDDGLDTLAGYVDGSCRYVNHSGEVLIWEVGPGGSEVDRHLRTLLAPGAAVAAEIGPWEGERPALPSGLVRLSMLCAGGLYFGEGPNP
jgi:hypothetical protein